MAENVLSFSKKVEDKPTTVADKKPQVYHLITGEDILGIDKGVVDQKNIITINKPVRIIIVPGAGGQAQMAFLPVSPFGDVTTLKLDDTHVLWQVEANAQIEAEYKKQFSKIILPGLVMPT